MSFVAGVREIHLRWAARCRQCQTELDVGMWAQHDPADGRVTCLSCASVVVSTPAAGRAVTGPIAASA